MRHKQMATTLLWTLGEDFDVDEVNTEIALTLHPQAFPVRWNQCSTIADFCTNYLSTRERFQPAGDAINYVLNELVENAVKFSAGETIQIALGNDGNTFVIVVDNDVAPDTVDQVKTTLAALIADDPIELLMQRVEENAENPERDGSGLGFLTMMTDYQTRVGWRLTTGANRDAAPRLRTIALLDIT